MFDPLIPEVSPQNSGEDNVLRSRISICHCEQREAIQKGALLELCSGLLRVARNDGYLYSH